MCLQVQTSLGSRRSLDSDLFLAPWLCCGVAVVPGALPHPHVGGQRPPACPSTAALWNKGFTLTLTLKSQCRSEQEHGLALASMLVVPLQLTTS